MYGHRFNRDISKLLNDIECLGTVFTDGQNFVPAACQRTADINERSLCAPELFSQHYLGDAHCRY